RRFAGDGADVNLCAGLCGGLTHGIREDPEMTAIELTGEELGLSVLVSGRVDAVAPLPVAEILVTDLPVFCTAMIIPDPVGGGVGGGGNGISARAITGIAIIDGDEPFVAGLFKKRIVVIQRGHVWVF